MTILDAEGVVCKWLWPPFATPEGGREIRIRDDARPPTVKADFEGLEKLFDGDLTLLNRDAKDDQELRRPRSELVSHAGRGGRRP